MPKTLKFKKTLNTDPNENLGSPPALSGHAVKVRRSTVAVKRRAKHGVSQEEGEINISRTTEQRLLDRKILREKPVRSWEYILVTVLLGIVVGGGTVVYLAVSRSPVEPTNAPEIIIPEEQMPQTPSPGTASPKPEEPASVVEVQKVEILQTPTGFLNVRKGPGTNYQKIGAVNPGEIYDLVSQNLEAGWYEIRFAEGSTGWVTKQYAKVK